MKPLHFLLKCLLYPLLFDIVRMPGRSHSGPLPAMTADEIATENRLRDLVVGLSVGIGERNVARGLDQAASFVRDAFASLGYVPVDHKFSLDGRDYSNIEVEIRGTSRPQEILIVGAHYDTVFGSPGADDNASGVAALIELARRFRDSKPARTVRFVAFANEEHPTNVNAWEAMGSWFYARDCRKRDENIVGMLSLEMLGVYASAPGSQNYPFPFSLFYPSTGDFIGFVANRRSRSLVRQCLRSFRSHTAFPSQGTAAPELIRDIGRSDHWSFWQFGYQGVMVTDTSNFRYPLYHTPHDTPDKIDFSSFARVTLGLYRVVGDLIDRN